jgi:hypothetical protein
MSLVLIRKFSVKKDPKEKEYVGWKIFIVRNSGLRSLYFAKKRNYTENMWYKSSNMKVYYDNRGNYYSSGFHCFTTRREARREQKIESDHPTTVVRKVFIRKITATGEQNSCKVIIANEMYIPSNSKIDEV